MVSRVLVAGETRPELGVGGAPVQDTGRPAARVYHFTASPAFAATPSPSLYKTGRVAEANTATIDCSLNATDWKRLCQEANATPAGRAAR